MREAASESKWGWRSRQVMRLPLLSPVFKVWFFVLPKLEPLLRFPLFQTKDINFVKGDFVVTLGIWKISGTQRYWCMCDLHFFMGICDCSIILVAADKTNNPSSLSVSGPPWPNSWRMTSGQYWALSGFRFLDPTWLPSWIRLRMVYCERFVTFHIWTD